MVSFLAGLGAFGGGLAPQLNAIADQRANADFGNALASIYGGQTTQPSNPIASLFSGGQQTQSTPQVYTQPVPQIPTNTQPGSIQSPSPQPIQQPPPIQTTQPSPIGGVAQPGVTSPSQPPQPDPQASQPPQPAPQASQGQPQPRPQAQPEQNLGQGPLDLPTLVRNLVKQGVTGARLGNAVQRFIPLLNAQGLQQYRDLGLALRAEQLHSLEAERAWNQNPNAKGSPAQARVAAQGVAQQRLNQGQQRIDDANKKFETQEQDKLDKLRNAKSDKEALQAKQDLDKIAVQKRQELQQQLNIINSMGTSDEDKAAASARVKELNQQLQSATDEAIKARRTTGSQRAEPEVVQGKQVKHAIGDTITDPKTGIKYKFKGGDWDSRENFEPVQ